MKPTLTLFSRVTSYIGRGTKILTINYSLLTSLVLLLIVWGCGSSEYNSEENQIELLEPEKPSNPIYDLLNLKIVNEIEIQDSVEIFRMLSFDSWVSDNFVIDIEKRNNDLIKLRFKRFKIEYDCIPKLDSGTFTSDCIELIEEAENDLSTSQWDSLASTLIRNEFWELSEESSWINYPDLYHGDWWTIEAVYIKYDTIYHHEISRAAIGRYPAILKMGDHFKYLRDLGDTPVK